MFKWRPHAAVLRNCRLAAAATAAAPCQWQSLRQAGRLLEALLKKCVTCLLHVMRLWYGLFDRLIYWASLVVLMASRHILWCLQAATDFAKAVGLLSGKGWFAQAVAVMASDPTVILSPSWDVLAHYLPIHWSAFLTTTMLI